MIRKETHKIPNGFRGDAIQICSPGNGIPCADPELTVLWSEGFAPEGLDIVSGTSIAVAVNDKGYLQPADENHKPIGMIGTPLLGTKCIFNDINEEDKPDSYAGIGSPTGGVANYAETMSQLTPTVWQRGAMFQMGIAYKTAGDTKSIFEIKSGDALRVIKSTEITTSIEDGTLPILFAGEKNISGQYPKTKAMYAGRLVKWDSATDKADEIVGRAMAHRHPGQYDNYAYNGAFAFGYDLQGPATKGLSRDVFNYIGTSLGKKEFTTTILDFCVTL